MFFRINNTFPTNSDIVKGIRVKANGRPMPKIEDFTLKISSVTDLTNQKDLNVDIIQVGDCYYTKPFRLYFTNDYILFWDNNEADIHVQQTFTVSDRTAETNHPKGKLRG